MSRPTRIDQVIPAIVERDAVSNHTFEAQRLLHSMGFASDIFAAIIGPGAEGRVRPVRELGEAAGEERWLLYQCSIGSPVAERFAADPGPKLLDYHNITPAPLVERWIPPLAEESRLGRAQLAELAPLVGYAVADSPFNAAELEAFGFAVARVAPILIEAANLETAPDPDVLAALSAPAPGSRWLFVGQIAPHKAEHELVASLAYYRRAYPEDPARLCLVGREMGHAYRDAVERFARSLGLAEAVDLPGSVPPATLAAHYAAADVFVCLSHHEGFCIPLIEAMARGLPVVAADAAAVPGTVGDAGILLSRRDPPYVAAAVHELLGDAALRAGLAERGALRAATFSLEAARTTFVAEIGAAVALLGGE